MIFAVLRGNTLTVDISRTTRLQQGGLDARLQTVDGLCQCLHLGRLFAGSRQQTVTILHSLVVTGNKLRGGAISQADIRGDDLVFVFRIIDMLTQIVEHLDLGVSLRKTGRELVGHLDGLRGINREACHTALLLILLNLTFCRAKFFVDLRHAVIDKFLCTQGNLVFVGIGLTVIAIGQATEEVHATLDVFVSQRHQCDVGSLVCGLHRHGFQIIRSHYHRRKNRDIIDFIRLKLINRSTGQRQRTYGCLVTNWKRQGILGEDRLYPTLEDGAFNHITRAFTVNLQFHAGHSTSFDIGLIKTIEMNRVEFCIDRLLAIDDHITHTALTTIFGIKLQFLDHITQQNTRLKHLDLIVDTRGIGHESQINHVRQHLVGIGFLVLIFNQQTG